MHADAKIPDPTHVVPDLPLVIKNIINKACAKSPDQRYDSMHDVIKELAPVSQLIKKQTPFIIRLKKRSLLY